MINASLQMLQGEACSGSIGFIVSDCLAGRHRCSPLVSAWVLPLLTLLALEFQYLLSAQLPPAFAQGHRLIRQQLTTVDLQPLAPAMAEFGPDVKYLAAVADPCLPG